MSVTLTEWKAVVEDLARRVRERWPGLDTTTRDHDVSVRAPGALAGSLRLDVNTDTKGVWMVPRVSVGSSSAYLAPLAVAVAQHNEAGRVLDVLLYMAREVDGERIYPDGECPCEKCSGTGKAFRSKDPCDACSGSGKR